MAVRYSDSTFDFAGGTTACVGHSDPLPDAPQTARGLEPSRRHRCHRCLKLRAARRCGYWQFNRSVLWLDRSPPWIIADSY